MAASELDTRGRPSPECAPASPMLWIGEREPARLCWVSPSLARFLGHPEGAWRAPDFLRCLVDPDDLAGVLEAWRTVVRTREPRTVDFRATSARGQSVSLSVELSPIEDADGAGQVVGVVQARAAEVAPADTFSAQDAMRELSHALHKHEKLVDSIDGIVWEAEPSFRFTFVSRQAERLLGYPVERWFHEPDFWVTHVHPEDREWAASYCRAAVEKCLPHEFEYRMIAADGREVWLRDIVTVSTDAGRPHRLYGIMVDVTAQRGAQERLEHTVSLLEATLDSTADGLLVVDRQGQVAACNRRFRQIWNLPDTLLDVQEDAPVLRMVSERVKDPERFVARVRELYAAPEQESFDIIELRDGRVVERYSLPQRQRGAITGRVWSFRDVSQRVRAEREQDRLLREAQEAIQVRDDFVSIASHELKTPLTPLRLHLQTLRQALESGQSVPPARVDKALGQVRRLSALVNDLLDASSVGEGRLKLHRAPVSLADVVSEVCSDFSAASAQHALLCVVPPEDFPILGDRGRLAQVLTNLLENAFKYSPLGGAVRVTLAHAGGNAVLSVSDSGIGIPKEEQAHLFERFFRARNAPVSGFGGLGLGLYICRDIVEGHGGHIWVESEVGRGSTFHVSLPVLAPRALHQNHAPPA